MIKKYLFVILFTILTINFVSAYTITDIDIVESYTNDDSVSYRVNVSASDDVGVTEIPITIDSDKQGSAIDFDAVGSSGSYEAYFYIDLTSSTSSTQNDWPKIIVNNSDSVVVSGGAQSDTMIVDNINPVVGTISLISLGTNHNNFYKGDVNVSVSGYRDDETYIKRFIAYLVPASSVNNYKTSYEKKITTDDNSTTINLDLPDDVDDGNYFVVVDVEDIAGNLGQTASVIDAKKQAYLDNTSPQITSFSLSDEAEDGDEYFVSSSTFLFSVALEDDGVDIDTSSTKATIYDPDSTLITGGGAGDYNASFGGFYINIDDSFSEGSYQVNLVLNDLLNNSETIDFNVTIDTQEPDNNSFEISSITIDDDKDVTVTWSAAEDDLSGISHYDVYRSTFSFIEITTQEKIGTTSSLTYDDTSSKSQNTNYYYGIVAVDYAGNESSPNVDNVHTGPSISIDIEDGERYTKISTPTIDLTFSSDVNSLKFSCNKTTWSSYVSVSGTSHTYSSFNINSGSGCSSSVSDKTIYVKAFSETDYPNRTSVASDTITFDNVKPTTPSNVTVTQRDDGSLRVSWSQSTDEDSGINLYRVYYLVDVDDVTTSCSYFTTSGTYYDYSSNNDQRTYFRISAIDKAENESNLSSTVYGDTVRFGPSFSVSLSPANKIDDVYYVGGVPITISVESDEDLSATPSISIRLLPNSFESISVSGSNRVYSSTYTFTEDGDAEVRVYGVNNQNESAQDIYEIKVKTLAPTFDFNYSASEEGLFTFDISNVSEDVYRIQYVLSTSGQICMKEIDFFEEITEDVFDCEFDSTTVSDGVYDLQVVAYDAYYNTSTETIELEIDNVDEDQEDSGLLKTELEQEIEDLQSWLAVLNQLLIDVDSTVTEKLELLISKKDLGDLKYSQEDYFSAKQAYTQAKTNLNQIKELIPEKKEIRSTKTTTEIDVNKMVNLEAYISDANTISDTNALYTSKAITYDRVFSIVEINQKKYFIVSLIFYNNTTSEKTITVIEDVPSSFTSHVKNLVFNREVEILSVNPVIKDIITIPAESSTTLTYSLKSPITEVDVITKYSLIESSFSDVLIFSGGLDKDEIMYDVPINYRLLSYIFLIMLGLIFILVALGLISRSKKLKKESLVKPTTKEVMNKYFSKSDKTENLKQEPKSDNKEKNQNQQNDNKENKDNNQAQQDSKKDSKEEIKSQQEKSKKKFDDDYSFIMSAIKKRE